MVKVVRLAKPRGGPQTETRAAVPVAPPRECDCFDEDQLHSGDGGEQEHHGVRVRRPHPDDRVKVPVRSPRPRRDLRLARLPLLLAYLLVLLATPVGEAGFLWMHLETAHSVPAQPNADQEHPARLRLGGGEAISAHALEREHHGLPAHEHDAMRERATGHGHAHPHARPHEEERAAADAPAHHGRIASAGSEPQARSVAPDQPHEHGGTVHTHQQQPAPDVELPNGALSKHYLSPPTPSAPLPSADARLARHVLPAPHLVAARIDTPPPRLPG